MDTAQATPARTHRLRGIVGSWSSDRAEILIPHTDYRLHLRPKENVPAQAAGTRVRGVVEGEAIRVHAMTGGGGRFIEPVIGEPRIITGILRDMDPAGNRLVIDAVVPFQLSTLADQDFSGLRIGGMVTCHVRSGLTLVVDAGAQG